MRNDPMSGGSSQERIGADTLTQKATEKADKDLSNEGDNRDRKLLEAIVETHEKGRSKEEKLTTLAILKQFLDKRRDLLERVEEAPSGASVSSLEEEIHTEINKIDNFVSEQLDRVIHHPHFQDIEARWRGLRRLVS